MAIVVEMRQEALDGVGDFGGGAAVTDGTGYGGELADAATYAEIVGIDHFAFVLDFFSFDADVGDPVLAAGVGAAGDVELDVFLISGETLFELLGEPAGVGLGFGESEFAEFGTGAGDGAANEGVGFNGETVRGELLDYGCDAGFGDVDEEKILHQGGAEMAVTVVFGEISGYAELRRRDAAADYVGADGEEIVLLLGDYAEVITMDGSGELFGGGGIKFVAELGFDGGQEAVGGPAVLEEKELEAGFFAGPVGESAVTETSRVGLGS